MHDEKNGRIDDPVSAELRQAYSSNTLVPLWESRTAATFGKPLEQANVWHWSTMLPIVLETGAIKAAHVLDRRVLLKTKPERLHPYDEAATGQLYCDFQLVLPGERAHAHRHPMNALRFVVQSAGKAKSIVNGKDCVMEPGDLILTPGGCWHEHVNEGDEPVIWLDVLDVGLHHVLGTTGFQPGPARDMAEQLPDSAFAASGCIPRLDGSHHLAQAYSPKFHYSWGDAVRALHAAPAAADGSRQIRYANPLTGGPCISLMDATLMQLEENEATRGYKSSASTVCYVVEGHGVSRIGDKTIEWAPHDVFTMPSNLWATHRSTDGVARIFQVSNRDVYRRLGLFNEAYAE